MENKMRFEYCIICEYWDDFDEDSGHISDSLDVCYGPFTTCEPPKVEDGQLGTDSLLEPDEDFMLISDQNADSLRLQFEGEE